MACLVLIILLALGGLDAGRAAISQAAGVRGLLHAGNGLSSQDLANPFICLRAAGDTDLAKQALLKLNDSYLQVVGLCLAGEREAGMAALKAAVGASIVEEQVAAGITVTDPQAGVDHVLSLGLAEAELVAVLQKVSAQPGIEPYPALRALAQRANDQPVTWSLWLQGSTRLEQAGDWQAAQDWLEEGLTIAPEEVRGSLYLHAGWIYQARSDAQDYHAALAAYNQAIEDGGWINPSDEAHAYISRGEVYRSLQDEYSPEQALEEFQRALALLPGNYWALLNIGHLYMYNLKDLDQAESYYRQALAADDQIPHAYFYLGEVYYGRGDKTSAAAWYQLALDYQPNWQPALDRLNTLTGAGELEGK